MCRRAPGEAGMQKAHIARGARTKRCRSKRGTIPENKILSRRAEVTDGKGVAQACKGFKRLQMGWRAKSSGCWRLEAGM